MADRSIKMRDLIRLLARLDIEWIQRRGKGSHGVFVQTLPDGTKRTFPMPGNRKDVLVSYMGPLRRRFGLSADDGVSDDEFYGK